MSQASDDLLHRCHVLLDEVERFQAYLLTERPYKFRNVGLERFKRQIITERNILEKAKGNHCSNLPFHEAVWNTVKGSTGIVILGKSVASSGEARHQRQNTVVDIVARGGLEWIKVSLHNERRLLLEMAKAGWMQDTSSDEEDGNIAENYVKDSRPEGLLKHIKSYLEASRTVRIDYRNPQVRLVLPNISRCDAVKEVKDFLSQVETLGVTVQTSDDTNDPPSIHAVLPQLVFDPFLSFSSVINIDCTILLAFISDLSHERVEAKEWYHSAVVRQIEVEKETQLLPNILWPACGSRKLVCVEKAASTMFKIVDTMGTESERHRAKLLFKRDYDLSPEERRESFQKLSAYQIPSSWRLPIEIISEERDLTAIRWSLPAISQEVVKHLTELNESVFFYGWAQKITTITSNGEIAHKIAAVVENSRTSEEDKGPAIWVCGTARSLVGKERTRKVKASRTGEDASMSNGT